MEITSNNTLTHPHSSCKNILPLSRLFLSGNTSPTLCPTEGFQHRQSFLSLARVEIRSNLDLHHSRILFSTLGPRSRHRTQRRRIRVSPQHWCTKFKSRYFSVWLLNRDWVSLLLPATIFPSATEVAVRSRRERGQHIKGPRELSLCTQQCLKSVPPPGLWV